MPKRKPAPPPKKRRVLKQFRNRDPPTYERCLDLLNQKQVEDLEVDTSTLIGNETGLLAASVHRLVVNKYAAQSSCALPCYSGQHKELRKMRNQTSHTLIHKAFTPP